MFYELSKLYRLFADPLLMAFVLLALAGLLAAIRCRRSAVACGVTAGAIYFATCFTTLGHVLIDMLESRFERPAARSAVDGVVLLGGGLDNLISGARATVELNEGGDRFVEALRLARAYPRARLVVSGGLGPGEDIAEGDAVIAPRFFGAFGIGADRLVLENRSRNTAENAVYALDAAKPQGGEVWLLVTSAFHMPRSVGCFRQAGFDVVPWPVDYRSTVRGAYLAVDFADPAGNARALSTAMNEWTGLLAYWLTGRTGTFFPGPVTSSAGGGDPGQG